MDIVDRGTEAHNISIILRGQTCVVDNFGMQQSVTGLPHSGNFAVLQRAAALLMLLQPPQGYLSQLSRANSYVVATSCTPSSSACFSAIPSALGARHFTATLICREVGQGMNSDAVRAP